MQKSERFIRTGFGQSEFAYTVRCTAATREVADAFRTWLVDGHLRDVCDAGASRAEVVALDDGLTLESRYTFDSRAAFEAYERDHAARLRAEGLALFPSGVAFTRTTGDVVFAERARQVEITPIALLSDNYAYVMTFAPHREAVVIDPSEEGPVTAFLRTNGLTLGAIWCTHHHFDHVGGVPALKKVWGEVPVLGSAYDFAHKRIEGQTLGLEDGERIEVLGRLFSVMNVPGHTLGAIAYFGEGNAGGAGNVFTGDTLFLGGCGRVFEGTMPMMRASLMRLAALPSETRVWVGHEYTAKNLEFALHVEPSNAEAASRLERVRALRAAMTPTVPGTIGEERATNPFLRSEQEALRVFTKAAPPDDVFAAVRAAKDKF